MNKLTRYNIAHNLNISPFHHEIDYGNGNILKYVFSSELYKSKFIDKLQSNRESINTSLSNRFGFTVVNDVLCDIKLYSTIEKRGFLLYSAGEKVEWLSNIELNGLTVKVRV